MLLGYTFNFTGSATFSIDGANATYNCNFGDGNMATGTNFSTIKYNGTGHFF